VGADLSALYRSDVPVSADDAEQVRMIVDWTLLIGALVGSLVGAAGHGFGLAVAFAVSFSVFEVSINVMTRLR
jgi:hypothetical protein